jgi:2-haloacid dehalogenase
MIDTIIFDLGGVLIDWNPRHFYKDIFSDNDKMEWFLSNVCTNEWNLEQDKGRPFTDGIAMLKKCFPEHSANIDFFYSHWEQMIKGEISGSVEILKQLKEEYKIYGLTNWSSETFPIAFDRFDFLHLFDGIVVSGIEKMIKPEKEFFQLLIERYELKIESCLFIDDDKKNTNVATELGLQVIHFTDPECLKSELRALDVSL